jgi:hypothetical protein
MAIRSSVEAWGFSPTNERLIEWPFRPGLFGLPINSPQPSSSLKSYTENSNIPKAPRRKGGESVFRELAKAVALILSIASIYALLGSAFFVPGSTWDTRLAAAIETLIMTGCVCFGSGLLFSLTERPASGRFVPPVTRTLPVQLFFWSLGATVLMFLLSRYLEVYYIPYIWKNQPW